MLPRIATYSVQKYHGASIQIIYMLAAQGAMAADYGNPLSRILLVRYSE